MNIHKKTNSRFLLFAGFLALAVLAGACSSSRPAGAGQAAPDLPPASLEQIPEAKAHPTQPLGDRTPQAGLAQTRDLSRTDEQGNVSVTITPLGSMGQTLDFEVVMDTHSVDLSMDLTSLATLTTGSGMQISALAWDGDVGGHHVKGTLSFPEVPPDEVNSLTLTLVEVDVPQRVFRWALP